PVERGRVPVLALFAARLVDVAVPANARDALAPDADRPHAGVAPRSVRVAFARRDDPGVLARVVAACVHPTPVWVGHTSIARDETERARHDLPPAHARSYRAGGALLHGQFFAWPRIAPRRGDDPSRQNPSARSQA